MLLSGGVNNLQIYDYETTGHGAYYYIRHARVQKFYLPKSLQTAEYCCVSGIINPHYNELRVQNLDPE